MGLTENKASEEKEAFSPFILGSIAHALTFLIFDMISFALYISLERELADLKGIIDPKKFVNINDEGIGNWDVEAELLENLDDPIIKVLIGAMAAIVETANSFSNINALDWDVLFFDKEAINQASEAVDIMGAFEATGKTDEDIIDDCYCYYSFLDYAISMMILRIKYNTVDIYERDNEMYDDDFVTDSDGVNVHLLNDLRDTLMRRMQFTE
ncbi:MAG: hypothetical protein EOO85_19925 [Pedobacter sp.]|nr:MAG: hypothetical protein EOO85_19925 [Pedobacter sp.]